MSGSRKSILLVGLVLCLAGGGLLAAGLAWGPEDRLETAYTSLREADELLRQNSPEAARRASVIFNQVLAQDIDKRTNDIARYGLGVSLERLGDRAAALNYYRELKAEGVEDAHLAERLDYSLGKLYLFINHEEEGRSLLENLLFRTKDDGLKSRIHAAYGVFYLKKGDAERAEENFRVALKYDPDNLQAEEGRARAIQGRGQDWIAYEYYDDYLIGNANLDPAGRERLAFEVRRDAYNSGIRAYRAGDYEDAMRLFERARISGGNDEITEKALYWYAESVMAHGDTEEAMEAYDQVLANANNEMDQPALIKRGIVLFNRDRFTEAARAFHRAVSEYPGGDYTEKAIEWKRETEAQIRERSILEQFAR